VASAFLKFVRDTGGKLSQRILAGWVNELAVPIYRGREVTGFTEDTPGSMSSCSMANRCGRNISSGVTADAV